MIEFADHLHEHMVDPAVVRAGRYRVPLRPGYGAEMLPEALAQYAYPDGDEWRAAAVIADEMNR